jgi:glycosyltransferase involved in cell wall biosynthesis
MRIAINATCFSNRPTGARNRFVGIYGKLFQLLAHDEFYVYEPVDIRISTWFPPRSNVHFIATGQRSELPGQRYLSGKLFWSSELKRLKPDVFETSHLPLVRSPVGRTIQTIHDIRYLRHPELYSVFRRLINQTVLRTALNRADLIVTVSHAMRKELLEFHPKANVRVVYNGFDGSTYGLLSDQKAREIAQKLKVPPNFLLSVGHLEKRKNYPRLLQALKRINQRGHDFHLVIVGNVGDEMAEIHRQIALLDLSKNVQILRYLEDPELRALYSLCRLFVFPSSYEGFGIPILEAMASGCPFVLSNLPVFREITEDRCVYFDPHNTESLAEVLLRTLQSGLEMKKIADYGAKRVKDFEYENIALEVAKIYRA